MDPGDWSHGEYRVRKTIIAPEEGEKLEDRNTNIIRVANMSYLIVFNFLKLGPKTLKQKRGGRAIDFV